MGNILFIKMLSQKIGGVMKKLFVSIVLGILFSVHSFALDFTFGAKLGCQFDGGTTISPAIAADMKALNARNISKNNNIPLPTFGVYGLFEIRDLGSGKLSLQVDANFKPSWKKYDYEYAIELPGINEKVSSSVSFSMDNFRLDIPVLAVYSKSLGERFEYGVGLGPLISFSLGAEYGTSSYSSGQYNYSNDDLTGSAMPNFGFVLDVNGKFSLGKNKKFKIIADARYNCDFTITKFVYNGEISPFFTYRSLDFGIGVEYKIK